MGTTTFSQIKTLKHKNFWYVGLVIGAAISLLVFTGLIVQQKLQNDQVELAQPDRSLVFEGRLASLPRFGQTFVPRQAGLRGVYLPISVEPKSGSQGALTLHLRTSPEATEDIRTASLSIAELEGQNLARFSFAPLPDSFDARYYFFIEPRPGAGEATLKLHYGQATAYVDGALYLDGQPYEGQASFFLAYDRGLMLRDWGDWFVKNSLKLWPLLLLLLLPGGCLLLWFYPGHTLFTTRTDAFNHIEHLAIAAALSIAIYPVLLLWAGIIGVKSGRGFVLLVLVLSSLGLIGKIYLHYKQRRKAGGLSLKAVISSWRPRRPSLPAPPILLFWIIFLLSAAVRIFVVRGQDIPLWQDAYHHVMISQLIVDNQGLFESWAPYAAMTSFSYHFGFHTFVAFYHWLTDISIFQAVIVTGQLMNVLAVPAVFLLGRRLGGSDWTGTFAALITGLLSQQPMVYVNWSRFTQLAGQVILPAAIVLTWFVLKSEKRNYKLMTLTAIAGAGLALTHYRVLLFYPCFIAASFLFRWLQAQGSLKTLRTYGLSLTLIAGGSLLLVSPWLWQNLNSRLWQGGGKLALSDSSGQFRNNLINEIIANNPSIFDYLLPPIVILGFVGIIWGNWQRYEGILVISSWTVWLVLLTNPHFIHLPGAGLIPYPNFLIAAYLPFSVLAGFTLGQAARRLVSFRRSLGWVIVAPVLLVSLNGLPRQALIFEPGHGMVAKPDLRAMAWVRENLPEEATFWINARTAYGGGMIVGTDAGWWLPFLTGRQGLIPPLLYATETTDPVDYPYQLHRLHQQIRRRDVASFETWRTLKQAGVTHIYIGQRRGGVWPGPEQPLDPTVLNRSPYYDLIYQNDQVRIFQLNNPM